MNDYLLRTARVDELELPDADRDQARAMAGELAAALTLDRQKVMLGASHMVEHYCGRAFWAGAGGAVRKSTAEIEVFGAPEIPTCCSLPDSQGAIAVLSVKKWSNTTEAYEDSDYKLRPSNRIRLTNGGVYEVICTVLPENPAPAEAVEAMSRVYSYQTQHRGGGRSLAQSGEYEPPRLQGALMRSGASALLRNLRRARA